MSPFLRAPPPHSFPSSVSDMTSATTPRLTRQRPGAVGADADRQAVVRLRGFDGKYDEFRIVGLQVGYLQFATIARDIETHSSSF